MWKSLELLGGNRFCECLRVAGCGGRDYREPPLVPVRVVVQTEMSGRGGGYKHVVKRRKEEYGGEEPPKKNSSSEGEEGAAKRRPQKKGLQSYARVTVSSPPQTYPGPSRPATSAAAAPPLQEGNFPRGNQQQRPRHPPPPAPNTAMGNQGIRQHVETSTKTGVFHLSKAKLHEFPPELAKIVTSLRSIDLSENKIQTIPQNISAFTNLKMLNLSSNQIESIPEQIGQLSKLETLLLSHNRISSVPSTLCHLQKLRDVNLSNNHLTSFPVVLCSLKFLTALDLSHNRIPSVPDGVQDLQVVELILNQNQVNSVSRDLARCTNLRTLRLQENNLELGGIPTELLGDSQISLISLEGNLFDVKQLSDLDGYEKYMERYTQTKKKLT